MRGSGRRGPPTTPPGSGHPNRPNCHPPHWTWLSTAVRGYVCVSMFPTFVLVHAFFCALTLSLLQKTPPYHPEQGQAPQLLHTLRVTTKRGGAQRERGQRPGGMAPWLSSPLPGHLDSGPLRESSQWLGGGSRVLELSLHRHELPQGQGRMGLCLSAQPGPVHGIEQTYTRVCREKETKPC